MAAPAKVRIMEVGPRDGLQNEPRAMPTADKIRLIESLAAAGLGEIEATSFTHPSWIPNLADAEEVVATARDLGATLFALVPNPRGLERAMKAKAPGVTFVFSASDGHNRANLNRSSEESLSDVLAMWGDTRNSAAKRRVSVSTVFGCPYDGAVPEDRVVSIVDRLIGAGCDRIGLCDTIGVANPAQVSHMMRRLRDRHPTTAFELHFHNTWGRGLANVWAGLLEGVDRFDASIGGLGGCPFAPGATGNVATEDLIAMLDDMGVDSGVSLARLLDADVALGHWRGRDLDSAVWRTTRSTGGRATVESGLRQRL